MNETEQAEALEAESRPFVARGEPTKIICENNFTRQLFSSGRDVIRHKGSNSTTRASPRASEVASCSGRQTIAIYIERGKRERSGGGRA